MDSEFTCEQESQNTQAKVKKMQHCADSSTPMASSGCFDCNICLDFAVDPVVTLCGHLYCWPCIYKWLQLESTSPPQCPVCKAVLSQTTLVPLYGRGSKASNQNDPTANIPNRPSVQYTRRRMEASLVETELSHSISRQRNYHRNSSALLDATVSAPILHPILRGTAIAVMPWVFGDHLSGNDLYYSSPHYIVGGSDTPRVQRHEMEMKRSLHRISIFLFCCAILCLLLF